MKIKIKLYHISIFFYNLFLISCSGGGGSSGGPPSNPATLSVQNTSQAITGTINQFSSQLLAPITVPVLNKTSTFGRVEGIARDSNGNLYIADADNHLIRKITPEGIVTTLAGQANIYGSSDGNGTNATFAYPTGLAVDSFNNLFVADSLNNIIRKITPDGNVSTFAGTAGENNSGSTDAPNGPASLAKFYNPIGITIDSLNNLYITDTYNSTIRKITPTGFVTTIAGSGNPNIAVNLFWPRGITINNDDDLYIADTENNTIRKIVLSTKTVTNIVGPAVPYVYGYVDGPSASAQLSFPEGIALDSANGNLFVIDSLNDAIRKITPAGNVSTFAGGTASGSTAVFSSPSDITIDPSGNLFVVDEFNYVIRKITPARVVTTLAGIQGISGSNDNGGPRAEVALFNIPRGIATDNAGNVYITDWMNNKIRKISAAGEVTTLAGTGSMIFNDGSGATAAFFAPQGAAVDSSGNVFIADTDHDVIRKITPLGFVSTYAGVADSPGLTESPLGPATAAQFASPRGLTFDSIGNLYVSDSGNHAIRKITPAGVVSTINSGTFSLPIGIKVDHSGNIYVAAKSQNLIGKITPNGSVSTLAVLPTASYAEGIALNANDTKLYVTGTNQHTILEIDLSSQNVSIIAGMSGITGSVDDKGPAARFNNPVDISFGKDKNLYITEYSNNTIRKMNTITKMVTTLSGVTGAIGSVDTIKPATPFLTQGGIAQGPDKRLYAADTFNHRIIKFSEDGKSYEVLAGTGFEGHDDGNGTLASFRFPQGITVDHNNNIYVADTFNHTIRKIDPSGYVSTFAGEQGNNALQNGTGTAAWFNYPQGITHDSSGNLYVADSLNYAVRKITPNGEVTTIAGQGFPGGYIDGPNSNALFGQLRSITIDQLGDIYVADIGNNLIRKIKTTAGTTETIVNKLSGVAVSNDDAMNVYISDFSNSMIYRISKNGNIALVAGTQGQSDLATSGALPGKLLKPSSIVVDQSGKFLYVLQDTTISRIEFDN